MSVKAKFQLTAVTEFYSTDGTVTGKSVKLNAVMGDSPENKSWSTYTPSGEITMYITNPDAYDQFEKGKEYFVTFEKAE